MVFIIMLFDNSKTTPDTRACSAVSNKLKKAAYAIQNKFLYKYVHDDLNKYIHYVYER